ncbi:MAG: ammonia-forming cytochrome c nitrite reductase subunit c552 [Nitrospira sp.]|nr:ammonia-forming cytochrome c nitrite reductase subunit c552 [bacterium]MBL7050310.1 ammonia-forming cytochrome c nitrite reductase subunit c552 [Nitrospira sp.]
MKSIFWQHGVKAILIIFVMAAMAGCTDHDEPLNPGKLPELGNPEYVGSERCKECHWKEHDSWNHTLHSKFLQTASKRSVIGDFSRNNTLTIKVTDKSPIQAGESITARFSIRNGKYYIHAVGPEWDPRDYEVKYVIGINRKQNYVTEFPNGELHVLPVEWLVEEQRWVDSSGLQDHYPGDGKYWSDGQMIWQFKCGSCHVTGMKINYSKESDKFNTEWVDLGIGCEACHGPGSDHIMAARVLFEKEKETIINPSKLPWRLRAAVCGQCHNWGKSYEKVPRERDDFPLNYAFAKGYQVGEPLYLYYDEELSDDKKHHQQYNEWEKSPHAKAGVMCTTCHAVHQEGLHKNPHKALTKYIADTVCTNCHTAVEKKAAHRIHTFGSCIACHMPESRGYEHSHTFEFVSPEESLRAGGVDKKPNSCSGCHHHKDSPLEGLVEFLDAVKKDDMPIPFSVHGR